MKHRVWIFLLASMALFFAISVGPMRGPLAGAATGTVDPGCGGQIDVDTDTEAETSTALSSKELQPAGKPAWRLHDDEIAKLWQVKQEPTTLSLSGESTLDLLCWPEPEQNSEIRVYVDGAKKSQALSDFVTDDQHRCFQCGAAAALGSICIDQFDDENHVGRHASAIVRIDGRLFSSPPAWADVGESKSKEDLTSVPLYRVEADDTSCAPGHDADVDLAETDKTPLPDFDDDGFLPTQSSRIYVANVAVETNHQLYELFGFHGESQIPLMLSYVRQVFAAANVLYNRSLNISLQPTTVFIYTRAAGDPFVDVTDVQSAGQRMRELWSDPQNPKSGMQRAIAHLFAGGMGNGVGYPDPLCSSGAVGVTGLHTRNLIPEYAGLAESADGVPVGATALASAVRTFVHELGHEFSAPHTHEVEPAIDCCDAPRGTPDRDAWIATCVEQLYGGDVDEQRRAEASSWLMSHCAARRLEFSQRMKEEYLYRARVRGIDDACLLPRENHAPQIAHNRISAPAQVQNGRFFDVSVVSRDEDGDQLAYLWRFAGRSVESFDGRARLRATSPSACGVMSIAVSVFDGKGGVTDATTEVDVRCR